MWRSLFDTVIAPSHSSLQSRHANPVTGEPSGNRFSQCSVSEPSNLRSRPGAALVVAKGRAKSIPILTAIGVTAIDRRTRIYGGARFGRIGAPDRSVDPSSLAELPLTRRRCQPSRLPLEWPRRADDLIGLRGSGSTALAMGRVERRLAAILAADVAGYSPLDKGEASLHWTRLLVSLGSWPSHFGSAARRVSIQSAVAPGKVASSSRASAFVWMTHGITAGASPSSGWQANSRRMPLGS